jgi:hypothetical protein
VNSMPNSKRRHKSDLQPITYDELVNSSSMDGLISFLDVRPGAPTSGAPEVSSAPVNEDSRPDVIPFPALVPQNTPLGDKYRLSRDASIGAPNVGAPEFPAEPEREAEAGFFTLSSPDIIHPRRLELREARYAQDGHTSGEQRLYEVLYKLGRPIAKHANAVTIGERSLASQARMSYSSVQENARSLARKLAIEIRAASSKNSPKTYVVFSYDEILKRRRAVGLTHYFRRTSAVELVAPKSVDPSMFSIVANESGKSGAPSSGAPELGKTLSQSHGSEIDSSFPHQVLAAIRTTLLKADDDAALRIVAECRKVAPDVTAAEIADFILLEGPAIARNKSVQNPLGVLIRHIPRCCGETLKQLRAEKARSETDQPDGSKREQAKSATAAEILADPASTEEDRAWARAFLTD